MIVLAKCSVQCSDNKEDVFIHDVFVPVVNRGHGYAQVLLRLVLERLDCFEVHVQASSDNVPANKTYKKVFGAPVAVEDGFTHYYFEKQIKDIVFY